MKLGLSIILVLTSTVSIFAGTCSMVDSLWLNQGRNSSLKDISAKISEIDESCLGPVLSKLISRKHNWDSLAIFVRIWSQRNGFSNQALFSCYREGLSGHRKVWDAIVSSWELTNGLAQDVFAGLVNSGKPVVADSLFTIFEAEGKLDVHDFLRWAKVKSITGDFRRIPGLYCRVLSNERRLASIALSQFANILDDVPTGSADSILQSFYRCSLGRNGADTVMICAWLANTYSRLGLYERELEVLGSLQDIPVVKERLLVTARSHFTIKQYEQAIAAARLVYRGAGNDKLKIQAATIIYQSFIEQGKNDSALIWVELAGFKSEMAKLEAVVLYQNAGSLKRAQSLIDSLGRSLARDSLTVRQLLFKGETGKAVQAVSDATFLPKSERHNVLWKCRAYLFDKKTSDMSEFLKSVKIQPSWEQSEELLSYKYYLQRFANSFVALDVWAEIEYNIYIGNFESTINLLTANAVPSQLKWYLVLRAAKVLIEKGMSAPAIKLLACCSDTRVSAEFLYYKAEALYRESDIDSALSIMKNVVLNSPPGVFSEKARLFLSDIELKKK